MINRLFDIICASSAMILSRTNLPGPWTKLCRKHMSSRCGFGFEPRLPVNRNDSQQPTRRTADGPPTTHGGVFFPDSTVAGILRGFRHRVDVLS